MTGTRPRLRALREERSWTQQDVADQVSRLAWLRSRERVGINADMVAKWERGDKRPSPRYRALLCLLYVALQAYQVLERRYRQALSPQAPASEQRQTAEGLLRAFAGYGLLIHRVCVGRVVHATRLTSRQRHILNQLSLPTPAQTLARRLHPVPSG